MECESNHANAGRRLLFTISLVVTMVVFAVWSDSYSNHLNIAWRNWLGFSALSLAELQWHQTLTSLVLTVGERQFVQTILMLCVSVGLCEWQFGSRTAMTVFFVSHVIVTVGLALFVVLPLHYVGAEWASALASERDVGPSAGYYGCLGVVMASRTIRYQWPFVGLVFLVLAVRLCFSLQKLHVYPAAVSADLSHLAAFALGILMVRLGFAGCDRL